jgi:tetratricopeptide (TPR) repeat protein
VEAVGGCVGAAELLCAVLALAALRCYAACVASAAARSRVRSVAQLLAALALAAAATLAKETGLSVLGAFVAYEWVHAATADAEAQQGPAQVVPPAPPQQQSGSAKQRRHAARKEATAPRFTAAPASSGPQPASEAAAARALRIGTSAAVGVAYILFRRWLLGGTVLVTSWRIVDNHLPFLPTRLSRGLSIAHAHWRFAYLLLWPAQLSADWGYSCIPPLTKWSDPRNAGAAALYATATWVLLSARPWRRSGEQLRCARVRLFHAAALCGAPLLPAANVLFFVGAFLAERLLYLPSVGFCMALAAPLATAARATQPRPVLRNVARIIAAITLVAYAIRCIARVPAWDSEATLFAAALHTCPRSAKMRVNAGVQARIRGDCTAAVRHFRVALEVLPRDYCEPHYGLGLCAADDGRLGEAADYFEKSMECLETADNAEDALRKTLSSLHAAHPREPSVLLAYARLAMRSRGEAAADEACAAAGAAARMLLEAGQAGAAAAATELCPMGAAAAAKAGAKPPRGLSAGADCDAASRAALAEVAAIGGDTGKRAEIGTAFVKREGPTCRGTKAYVEAVSALQNADAYNPWLHMEWARLLRAMAGRDAEAAAHADFAVRVFEQQAASARRTPAGQAAARLATAARAEAASWEGTAAGPRSVRSLVNKPLPLKEL